MFITNTNRFLHTRPQLTRVWINTGEQRIPLKAVWLDEANLRSLVNADCMHHAEDETAELTDDHSCLAGTLGTGRRSERRLEALAHDRRLPSAAGYRSTENRAMVQFIFPRNHT